jgi:hypothetical protein
VHPPDCLITAIRMRGIVIPTVLFLALIPRVSSADALTLGLYDLTLSSVTFGGNSGV